MIRILPAVFLGFPTAIAGAAGVLMLVLASLAMSDPHTAWLLSGWCHQHPERSYLIDGHQFGLCARCTGIYLGAAAAAVLSCAKRLPALSSPVVVAAGAYAALSVMLWAVGMDTPNWFRLSSGLSLGAVLVMLTRALWHGATNRMVSALGL